MEVERGRDAAFAVVADRIELLRGIRALQAAESRTRQRAIVWLDGGRLRIAFGDVRVSAHATGTWAGEVAIPARSFRRLHSRGDEEFNKASTVLVRARAGRFFVGPVSCIGTRWWDVRRGQNAQSRSAS